MAGHDAGQAQPPKRKLDVAAARSSAHASELVPQRKLDDGVEDNAATSSAPAPASEATPRDVDLFTVEAGDAILGFKNATTCGRLAVELRPLGKGERIFLKIGETEADCRFSVECYGFMRQLGMPSVNATVTHATFSLEWWTDYAHATDPSEKKCWAAPLLRKMARSAAKTVPVFLASEFAGRRLMYVPADEPCLQTEAFGRSLTQALLFSKRVGAKDLGPFNMMLNTTGHVLQVDINAADAAQLARFNKKGLQTSHKFDSRFWKHAMEFTRAHPTEVAAFLREMLRVVPLAAGVKTDLFSLETITALANGDSESFMRLW